MNYVAQHIKIASWPQFDVFPVAYVKMANKTSYVFQIYIFRSVKDLARLSLKEPMYVSVHEMAKHSTPPQLRQSYVVCEQHEKLDMLWSFVKNHLKAKTLVFLTSCKEVS